MNEQELQAELEANHAAAFGWALSCCRSDRAEAEDVLQTVYLKILQGRARFDGKSAFKTWLFSVIRVTAADVRRWHWRRSVGLSTYAAESGNESAMHDSGRERTELREVFKRALSKLARRQREVLHLVFYQDMSIEAAAGIMGVSIGSARTHYERGKSNLRGVLQSMEGIHAE